MGKLSRTKGRSYEQRIANVLRAQWPGIEVRRSSQADRAVNSDVYITNAPLKLERLWLECQDSRKPTPTVKLAANPPAVYADRGPSVALSDDGHQAYTLESEGVLGHDPYVAAWCRDGQDRRPPPVQ